jgi:hypothetical protein
MSLTQENSISADRTRAGQDCGQVVPGMWSTSEACPAAGADGA